MCTVSFLPKAQGFYLAMNRDEKRERSRALAPTIVDLVSRPAVFPREPTGGTWISANDAGVCLALINWHRIEREPKHDVISRGEVVRELAGKSSADEIAYAVMKLPLRKLCPFRLIAIVPSEKIVTEWRWNLEWLTMRNHQWQLQHWFSSGLDERVPSVSASAFAMLLTISDLSETSDGCGSCTVRMRLNAGRSRSVCIARMQPQSAIRKARNDALQAWLVLFQPSPC